MIGYDKDTQGQFGWQVPLSWLCRPRAGWRWSPRVVAALPGLVVQSEPRTWVVPGVRAWGAREVGVQMGMGSIGLLCASCLPATCISPGDCQSRAPLIFFFFLKGIQPRYLPVQ